MKKIIQLIVICLVAFNMGATGYSSLEYLSMDFSESPDGNLYGGWTCWGCEKTPAPEVTESFNIQAGDPAYVIMGVGELSVPFSNSTTMEGGIVDEWLVSPGVDLPVDDVVLSFYVAAFGTLTQHNYEVYVSTTGNTKEDFGSEPVYKGSIMGNIQYAQTEMIRIPLNGYKGETIYLAFVNKSVNAMLTGFTNITIADYAVMIKNNTEKFVYESGEYPLDIVAQIMTPVECPGFKVKLEASNGIVSEYEETENLTEKFKSYSIDFPIQIELPEFQTVDYTITLTPNYAEAKPLVMTYSISCSEPFPKVVVMENATGAWNPYATYGCAAIDKYVDAFPEQFIPIEIHYYDGMQVDEYYPPIFAMTSGLSPLAVLNRADVVDTWDEEAVKKTIREQSPLIVNIVEADMNAETKQCYVKYAPKFGCDINSIDLTAVVVIRENNCTGTGRDWTQMNQLSGAKSAAQIGVTPDWWPYLKYYCEEAPEIVGYKFKYVGWGIFNDFEGSGVELPHAWKFDEPQEFIISFDLPDGVQNIGNTSVIVMIIDKESNEIIAADVMNADNYSSVERVENSFEYSVIQQNNALTINAECGAKVELFDVKGMCLGSYFMTSNMLCIDNLSSKGVILVRITKEHKTAIRKLIWKD